MIFDAKGERPFFTDRYFVFYQGRDWVGLVYWRYVYRKVGTRSRTPHVREFLYLLRYIIIIHPDLVFFCSHHQVDISGERKMLFNYDYNYEFWVEAIKILMQIFLVVRLATYFSPFLHKILLHLHLNSYHYRVIMIIIIVGLRVLSRNHSPPLKKTLFFLHIFRLSASISIMIIIIKAPCARQNNVLLVLRNNNYTSWFISFLQKNTWFIS